MRNNPKKSRTKSTELKKKNKGALQFSEDRLQLLDTIQEMVSDELDHRRLKLEGNPHPENPPPEAILDECSGSPIRRHSLWKRIMRLLSRKNNNDSNQQTRSLYE